jgi:putative hydrolase of the HAD superfamily
VSRTSRPNSRPIIVFDLDDTLYSEREFAISGFRACERWLTENHGVGGVVEEMTRLLDAGHMRALFEIVMADRVPGCSPAAVEAFIDVYRLHEPEIALYPDAQWALEHFGSHGPLGLITDGQHIVQSAKVRALQISEHFRHIVYTGALGGRAFSKPHPLSYEQMEMALRPHAGEGPFVYVGDNPAKDFVTPNARGWVSVQIVREHRIHARATTAAGGEPQHVIGCLSELPAALARAGLDAPGG